MGASYEGVEKRIFQRIDVEFPIQIRIPQKKDVINVNGKCKDIGGTGVGVVANREIPENENVWMELELPDQHHSYTVHARAIWNREIEKGLWRMGFSFQDIDLFKHWRIFRLPGVHKPAF